ncbi:MULTISPECIES: lysophospholipid acyltransferase family protein [Chromobacterium]|uniref:lysophospholipid acyltransferase family protein n=1 Tax=Chromobacterium TaxID=535 RepID=UPI000654A532|nr:MULTISPECIES: lysophospholipid acyltransferase family protein [Chromobacterium]KMN81716.1 acyl-phosphate glycerol 3-phosphate acyltransferase [Chromobacterium sp. LK11]
MKSIATTSLLTRIARVARLFGHLAIGVFILVTRYSRLAHAERAVVTRRWAAHALKILGISVRIQGVNPGFYPPNTLLVANHISWLDIFVLNSCTVSRFVAKRELRSWPVLGWLAHLGGTLFIDRSKRKDASRVYKALAHAMENGACMAVFPESTTSDGLNLLPFKASLFEAALLSRGTVQPVGLRYYDADGEQTLVPAFIGELTFLQSVRKVLAMPAMEVEVSYGQPLKAWENGLDTRFALAQQAQQEVARALRLSPPPAAEAPQEQNAERQL